MDDCLLLAENIVADDVYDFLVFGLVFRSNVLQANAVQGAAVLVVIRVRLVAPAIRGQVSSQVAVRQTDQAF